MKTAPMAANSVSAPEGKSSYPEPFQPVVAGRTKKRLGDFFGLENFGVNLTRLAPGAASALLHSHRTQDEFIDVLAGTPTLRLDREEFEMTPGDCMGFRAGSGIAHQLVNRGGDEAVYLEVGDRTPGDVCEYPDDDLRAEVGDDGRWRFLHKDGRPW